jgi:ParB-like chromosome segregation protein Spo0J
VRKLDLQIEEWPVERLFLSHVNPRTHTAEQVTQIAESIREFGFVNPILIGSDGVVIAGEGRLRAAKAEGMRDIPVIVLGHLSETQRRALVIADNQLALNAGWDEELLREQLAALREEAFDLDLLGFDHLELEQRLVAEDRAQFGEENAIPDMPSDPVTIPGDLWVLDSSRGRVHRILCGDSTADSDVTRLLG